MRGSEAIEEMEDRGFGVNGDQMGQRSQVGDFLNAVRRHDGNTRLTDGVNVLVIAKNRKGARRDAARRDVQHGG